MTFNTLLKDRELPDALDYAGALWDIGADAVIVQDMGLVRLLGKYLPKLPLHMSTQGTVTGRHGVDLMKAFGIRRIVPARELSLEEIREMAAVCHDEHSPATGFECSTSQTCEVEVFVHGALCMCYSGQCQMSRILGGGSVRSGNRGLCAQPCRLPYTDDRGRTGYFLSPKDLCLLEELPALCEAGVDSLKIEGRLKSPEYVAVVTGIYRKYLDQYARTGSVQVSREDWENLTQIYNRGGFTTGYLYGNPGEKILSGDSPKNTGIRIGRVRSVVDPRQAGKDRKAAAAAAKKQAALVDVSVREELEEGDGVEFRPPAGKNPYSERTTYGAPGGVVTFRKVMQGGTLRIGDMKGRIAAGDNVFRVTRRALLQRAGESFDTEDPAELDRRMRRKIPLKMLFEAAAESPAMLIIRERPSGKSSDEDASKRLAGDGIREETTDRSAVEDAAERPAGGSICVLSCGVMEEAHTRPADPARILQQLQKLGGTPFIAEKEDISIRLDGRCAVPVSEINRMRREGIDQLLQRKSRIDREPADTDLLAKAGRALADQSLQKPALPEGKLVPLMQFMEEPLPGGDASERVIPYIDAVSKGRLDAYLEERFDEIVSRLRAENTGILIRGTSWIGAFLVAGVKVYGGHGLNIYNEEARRAFEEIGVTVAELSHETGFSAEGAIPLMVTEHPVQSKTLTDRKGQVHRIERSPAGDKTIVW